MVRPCLNPLLPQNDKNVMKNQTLESEKYAQPNNKGLYLGSSTYLSSDSFNWYLLGT